MINIRNWPLKFNFSLPQILDKQRLRIPLMHGSPVGIRRRIDDLGFGRHLVPYQTTIFPGPERRLGHHLTMFGQAILQTETVKDLLSP